jgi:hypothetical protein
MDSKRGWLAWAGPRADFGFRCIPLLALAVDTARYILAPDVRVFGIRVTGSASGTRCADNNANDYLTLWIHVARVNRSTYRNGKETKEPLRTVRHTLHYDGKTYGTDTFHECWYGDAP